MNDEMIPTGIRSSQNGFRKLSNHANSGSFQTLRWVSAMLLIVLIPIACIHHDSQHLETLSSFFFDKEASRPSSQYSVQELDIVDEAEYLKLGLTPQKPLRITPISSADHGGKPQTIHGRFLHLTDFHPDEHYKEGSSIDNACHREKPYDAADRASKYGDAFKGCDSPIILMDDTLKWIKENLRDKIDFVIWTGDNIRHDNDRRFPRTEAKIFEMNRIVADKFHDVFHGDDELDPRNFVVPVIPSLGNNDVYPHNLFSPGPTLQTRELWAIWQNFVPEKQLHIFEKGAYFFTEIIPDQLAVLSINTLYLFRSNPLTDSCDNKKDPGYQLFQWLGVTLDELRSRNMKVWFSGHVPPIPKNYDLSCYRKFTVWVHEYRDIIIGGVYGHMNIDHFIPSDSKKAYDSIIESYTSRGYVFDQELVAPQQLEEDEIDHDLMTQYSKLGLDLNDVEHERNKDLSAYGGAPNNKESYMDAVREVFYADVKGVKNSGEHSERYSINNIAASIIPTFNPGMRVWEYNITGLKEELLSKKVHKPWDKFFEELETKMFEELEYDEEEEEEEEFHYHDEDTVDEKRKKKKKKKSPKQDPTFPPKKPDNIPLGPAYTPQLFSPNKYVQYYLDLKSVNNGDKPFGYEVEYKSDEAPLNLKSLLVDDFVKLARRLGAPVKAATRVTDVEAQKNGKKQKEKKAEELWKRFVEYAFVSSGYHDDGDE
jgi:endopolyphosphatase